MPECYNCDGYFTDNSDNSSGKCKDCRGIGKCSYCGIETYADDTDGCERCGYGDGLESAFVCTDCSMANTCGICDEMGSWCCMPRKYYMGGDVATLRIGRRVVGETVRLSSAGRPNAVAHTFATRATRVAIQNTTPRSWKAAILVATCILSFFTSGKGVYRTCDKIMGEKVEAAGKQE